MKNWRRGLAMALLAPLLVVAVSASSSLALRCRMTGMVSADTCCPHDDDAPSGDAQATVSAPGCCERLVISAAKPVASVEPTDDASPSVAVAIVVTADALRAPAPARARPLACDSWPGERPPLRLLKRSFLI